MSDFIVVESGAKIGTIRSFLGGDYEIVASGGHIVDLPPGELGVDVENDFAYRAVHLHYRGTDQVEKLSKKLADADTVYLATDPDREGEAIAADIQEHCVSDGAEVHRIAFNAIVYHAVKEALQNPRGIDTQLVEAQRTRRSLDRLIGFILSPMAQFDGPQCPAVGRVLGPAVQLLVDRERERRDFTERRYWTLHAAVGREEGEIEATFIDPDAATDAEDAPDLELEDFAVARDLAQRLQEAGEMVVAECEEEAHDELHPRPPFSTDTLQEAADALLGFSPGKTMRLAQELYQGVSIDGKSRALITYMRTDSTRVDGAAMAMAKDALQNRDDCSKDMYRGRPWSDTGGAQDAHEGIRPTHPDEPDLFPEALQGSIDEELLALYRLIYFRFLASQMVPAVYHSTRLSLEWNGMTACAEGHRLISPGFLTIYRKVRPDHGYREVDVPAVPAGTVLPVNRAWPWPGRTYRPPRYGEGRLVRELKERGIGRPSTYGDILDKIRHYRYAHRSRGKLKPTERAERLCHYLADRYQQVVDYDYTAQMERHLDAIVVGDEGYVEYLQREFRWLREPYQRGTRNGWIDGNLPTPAQTEYLKYLEKETAKKVPARVWKSKKAVSNWIGKLKKLLVPRLELSCIRKADVGDVECHVFRLYLYHGPAMDGEYAFLRGKGMAWERGAPWEPAAFRFSRQDRDCVEALRDELEKRYSGNDSPVAAQFRVRT